MRERVNDAILAGYIGLQDGLGRLRARLSGNAAGQTTVEWALIAAAVALVLVIAIKQLTPHINNSYNHVGNCVDAMQTPVTGTATITPSC